MKIGEIVRAQEPKMPQGVKCESFKDFKDFIVYCDVMNWHPDEKPYTYRGVATMELDHGVFGIFDAITNKGYLIFRNNEAYNKAQAKRCRDKYQNWDKTYLAQLDLNMNKDYQNWKREVIEYMRKYDA